mgnify:CR=1 FL=1
MTFKQICALFGGFSNVSRLLGMADKTCRDVRRAATNNQPKPHWVPRLKEHAKVQIKELEVFIEE